MRVAKMLFVALVAWCARTFRDRRDRAPVLHLRHGGPYGHVAAWRRRDTARRLHVLGVPVREAATRRDRCA